MDPFHLIIPDAYLISMYKNDHAQSLVTKLTQGLVALLTATTIVTCRLSSSFLAIPAFFHIPAAQASYTQAQDYCCNSTDDTRQRYKTNV